MPYLLPGPRRPGHYWPAGKAAGDWLLLAGGALPSGVTAVLMPSTDASTQVTQVELSVELSVFFFARSCTSH